MIRNIVMLVLLIVAQLLLNCGCASNDDAGYTATLTSKTGQVTSLSCSGYRIRKNYIRLYFDDTGNDGLPTRTYTDYSREGYDITITNSLGRNVVKGL